MEDPLLIGTLEEENLDFEASEHSDSENEVDDEFYFEIDGGADFAASKPEESKSKSNLDAIIEKQRKKLDLKDLDTFGAEGNEDEDENYEDRVTTKREAIPDQESDDEERKKAYFEDVDPLINHDAFTSLSISRPLLKAIAKMGFVKPTDIQSQTIPLALQGRDICGSAVTGSGKTAAFMIPIIERLLYRPKAIPAIRVLIIVPTRELGAQCHEVAVKLSSFSSITSCLCVGGLSNKQQEAQLKSNPDIVIATPGRLIDHIHNSPSFTLDHIEILVIDEADRILEVGFKDELTEIIKHTPVKRQTMLFSATMTDNVDELIQLSLNRPIRLFVDNVQSMTSKLVQEFIRIRNHREEQRPAILAALCSRTFKSETLIFFRSKAAAHHMKIIFGLLGLSAAELHGNLTQPQVKFM
jgi:ATP-dependent RNA helicase DDX27